MVLGKLRIEYKRDGNVIQIYNSPTVCSLVINGKVAKQYVGEIATRFVLKGTINEGDNVIPIEAKMGFFNMRLFVSGVCVAKKFMAFG